jgi:hypothetical protein
VPEPQTLALDELADRAWPVADRADGALVTLTMSKRLAAIEHAARTLVVCLRPPVDRFTTASLRSHQPEQDDPWIVHNAAEDVNICAFLFIAR